MRTEKETEIRPDAVFFDLDGTLTDPGLGITNSVMYALRHYGIEVEDRRSLYTFIGPPLVDSFQKYYGFSPEEAKRAVEIYREYFREKGLFENELYPGVPEMLAKLKENGYMISLATSKPDVFSERIIRHFGIDGYFDFLAANNLAETRSDKKAVIAYGLEGLEIKDPRRVVMVGDRRYDIEGGNFYGMKTVGVTYGYGSREELTGAGASYTVDSVCGLEKLLLSLRQSS